jgi:hypothetical protein
MIHLIDETTVRNEYAQREAAETLHEFVLSVSPATLGDMLHNRFEDKLAVLYGQLATYELGPF